jgi:hypothetical protein
MKLFKKSWLWLLCSSVVIILLGFLWHNLYEWLPFSLIAFIAPINESVWEHLKLTLWPTILTWFIMAPYFEAATASNAGKKALCITASSTCANLCILGIYYVFAGGIGISNMVIDIGSYIIGVIVGQTIASIHILPFKIPAWLRVAGWLLLADMVVMFGYLTYHPLSWPIFVSP